MRLELAGMLLTAIISSFIYQIYAVANPYYQEIRILFPPEKLELELPRLQHHHNYLIPASLSTQDGNAFLESSHIEKEESSQQPPDPTPTDSIFLGPRDSAIPSYGAPYPPNYLDINNVTSLQELARSAIVRMGTWFQSDDEYEWAQWWQQPLVGIFYADMDLAFGDQYNKGIIEDLLSVSNERGVSYMIDKYVDDQAWWGLFALKGYQLYGNNDWLQAAAMIQTNSSYWWDDTCGGGVLWLTYDPGYKNTVTNMLYMSLCARLYLLTAEQYYLEEALKTLNWWLGWAFDPTTGKVYDGMTPSPACEPTLLQVYTYNSGTPVMGLVDLYYATQNTTLLDLARTIAYAGIRDYSLSSSGVLKESCEDDPPPASGDPPGCQDDEVVYKGVFTAALGYLYKARPDENILNFLNTQLLSATFNDLDDTYLYGEWWYGPWNETTAGPETQICALGALSGAITADVAFANAVSGATDGAET